MTAPDRIWIDDDTWFSKPVTYPHAVEYLRADVVEARLSDPVAVHANMLRGTIAKPTVEQIVHLYGREALRIIGGNNCITCSAEAFNALFAEKHPAAMKGAEHE